MDKYLLKVFFLPFLRRRVFRKQTFQLLLIPRRRHLSSPTCQQRRSNCEPRSCRHCEPSWSDHPVCLQRLMCPILNSLEVNKFSGLPGLFKTEAGGSSSVLRSPICAGILLELSWSSYAFCTASSAMRSTDAEKTRIVPSLITKN